MTPLIKTIALFRRPETNATNRQMKFLMKDLKKSRMNITRARKPVRVKLNCNSRIAMNNNLNIELMSHIAGIKLFNRQTNRGFLSKTQPPSTNSNSNSIVKSYRKLWHLRSKWSWTTTVLCCSPTSSSRPPRITPPTRPSSKRKTKVSKRSRVSNSRANSSKTKPTTKFQAQ